MGDKQGNNEIWSLASRVPHPAETVTPVNTRTSVREPRNVRAWRVVRESFTEDKTPELVLEGWIGVCNLELPPKLGNMKVFEAWEYHQSQHTYRLRQDLSGNNPFASWFLWLIRGKAALSRDL